MFDKISFFHKDALKPLISMNVDFDHLDETLYNRENLSNSAFFIRGSVDSFLNPPITDFALNNLYHMESFNIFHYSKGSFTKRQNYHYFLILYVYSGTGTLVYRDKTYHLDKNDGFFINCMDLHTYTATSDVWDVGVLHINGPLLPHFHAQYMQHGSPLFHEPTTGNFQQLLEELLRIYDVPHLHRDWQASNCLGNILTHLLVSSTSEGNTSRQIPQNIRYLMRYIESNYSSHLTLDYLAEFANMNKYYLAKEFKKYTGFSPNDYVISLRINQAKQMLLSSDLPASVIAHEVGIHDMNNFTALFKKKVGMTPTQFRKNR